MPDVVYLVQDMLFTSKIGRWPSRPGSVSGRARPGGLLGAVAGAKLVILDLRLPAASDALARLAADPAGRAIPSVGFVDHEKVEIMDAARAQGCGQVMAKGQFSNALPKLLAGLSTAGG
jgi:hypothetical protein